MCFHKSFRKRPHVGAHREIGMFIAQTRGAIVADIGYILGRTRLHHGNHEATAIEKSTHQSASKAADGAGYGNYTSLLNLKSIASLWDLPRFESQIDQPRKLTSGIDAQGEPGSWKIANERHIPGLRTLHNSEVAPRPRTATAR